MRDQLKVEHVSLIEIFFFFFRRKETPWKKLLEIMTEQKEKLKSSKIKN